MLPMKKLLWLGLFFMGLLTACGGTPAGDFPALHFTTRYDPFAVARTFWHDAHLRVENPDGVVAFGAAVRLRGRGNSTWEHGAEKRPLRIRFAAPRPFLDAPHAAQDWVLIANLFDPALMRTHLAFDLGRRLDGLYWTPFSQFVHVYFNGEYQGVFQLADERDIGPGRAQLQADPDPARSEFLLEISGSSPTRDRLLYEGQIENIDFTFVNGWVIDVRYPHARDRDGHLNYLQAFLYRVDAAIQSGNLEAVAALVDLPSLIDFYLVQEWFKDIDVSDRSIFMQIKGQGENRRLHFGPLWDFDRSAGNMSAWHSPHYLFAGHYNDWFAALLRIPAFHDLTAARWQQIRHTAIPATLTYAQHLLTHYEQAFNRNFTHHHHIFNHPPHDPPAWFNMVGPPLRGLRTFREQAEYMIAWLETRAYWLDGFFGE